MKRLLSAAFPLFLCLSGSAQVLNNLVVFSNEGEKFTLILNGERYNNTPASSVKAENLTLTTYSVKIIFENKDYRDHDNTIRFYRTNKECVFGLKKKNKRRFTLEYISEKEIVPPPPPLPPPPPDTVKAPAKNPCTIGMTSSMFFSLKSEVAKLGSESGKLAIAGQKLGAACITTMQVKEMMGLFFGDKAKLEFAKRCYTQCTDPGNYTILLDEIKDAYMKEELKKFLESQK